MVISNPPGGSRPGMGSKPGRNAWWRSTERCVSLCVSISMILCDNKQSCYISPLTYPILGNSPDDELHMDMDLQHTALRHAADDSIESSICLGLLRGRGEREDGDEKVDVSTRAQHCSEEPPEITQFKAQRIFLSLCLQIIARYFVSETVPTYIADEARDTDDSNVDGLFLSVNNCSRSEMISRIRSFRTSGTEALFALAVVKNDGRILLTAADKQFALWTLREVCVAAFEAESSEGNSLMIWCKY